MNIWLTGLCNLIERTYAEIESDDSEDDIYHSTPTSQTQHPPVSYRRHNKAKHTSSYHEQHHYKKHKQMEQRSKPRYEQPASNAPYQQDSVPQHPKPEQYQRILGKFNNLIMVTPFTGRCVNPYLLFNLKVA